GDGSYTVSKKLADVGAIVSAGDFDTFLCNNGYDKKIRTGTYTIPANASEEQMARIITGAE
ncbi:MAG: endolytic transglycosylase MltG, partial [Lachnospiraceae bacterium]|nr:endolytic transglycosylase MltG [Lachnospiraceae bacterium]